MWEIWILLTGFQLFTCMLLVMIRQDISNLAKVMVYLDKGYDVDIEDKGVI